MNRTPLLRPLRENGATLYVFPSASEDIGLNLNSRATGVALSHYALLNLPNLMGKNTEKAESIAIATDLQNYVMNFETLLLNQEDYNYQEYHTVSERVFWHWLIDKQQKLSMTSDDNLYYHEDFTDKNRVVQCFGSIDAGSSLSTEFGMFNETYINIPTSYGNGPIFFEKNVQDTSETNYVINREYKLSNPTMLEGRPIETINTIKILESTEPLCDSDSDKKYIANSAYEIVKDFTKIQQAINNLKGITNDVIINSYDDINIDIKEQFKDSSCDITSKKVEFQFNAILLYYSVYDQDDLEKNTYAINLFGIIFLDSPKNMENDLCVINKLTKKKSFGGEGQNFFGNSYSFRVNIKTMSVYDNTDAIIQDNTTMSSIMSNDFSDVISNLNRAIDTMNTNVQTTMAIQDSYMNILRYYDEQRQNIEDISTKVNGFINGSKTSSFNVNLLRTNEICPENQEDNMIKLTLTRRMNDYVDNEMYQGTTYIPPIIIANDYDTFNVPTVYKPVMDLAPTAQGEWTNSIGNIKDIIDNITINYYTYGSKTYQNINLPEDIIKGYGLDNLYKTGTDFGYDDDETMKDVKYINYDALVPLMLSYIKDLRSEIEILKNQS